MWEDFHELFDSARHLCDPCREESGSPKTSRAADTTFFSAIRSNPGGIQQFALTLWHFEEDLKPGLGVAELGSETEQKETVQESLRPVGMKRARKELSWSSHSPEVWCLGIG